MLLDKLDGIIKIEFISKNPRNCTPKIILNGYPLSCTILYMAKSATFLRLFVDLCNSDALGNAIIVLTF